METPILYFILVQYVSIHIYTRRAHKNTTTVATVNAITAAKMNISTALYSIIFLTRMLQNIKRITML